MKRKIIFGIITLIQLTYGLILDNTNFVNGGKSIEHIDFGAGLIHFVMASDVKEIKLYRVENLSTVVVVYNQLIPQASYDLEGIVVKDNFIYISQDPTS